jgi:hypothetical protein
METTYASSIWSDISEHDDLWQYSTSKTNINTPHGIISPSGNTVSVLQMTGWCDMWWGGGASLYLPLSPGLINGEQATQSINAVWHANTREACCNLLVCRIEYNMLMFFIRYVWSDVVKKGISKNKIKVRDLHQMLQTNVNQLRNIVQNNLFTHILQLILQNLTTIWYWIN